VGVYTCTSKANIQERSSMVPLGHIISEIVEKVFVDSSLKRRPYC